MTRRFGAFEVDLATSELRKGGTPVRLQEQPAKILAVLLERPGEVVTREDLVKLLWPDGTFVDYDRGLNAAVNRLRQALSDSAESPRYVETVARRGYRFIGVVESTETRGQSGGPAQARAPVAQRWVWIGGALTALAFAAGAWLWRSRPVPVMPSMPVPLTSYDGVETDPSFSPDGSQIAFAWNGPAQDNFDIYVKVVGSDAPHRLTTHPAGDRNPVWSPDGRYIAFVREQQGIFVIPPVGGVERRIAGGPANSLCWSADSKHLAFARYRTGSNEPGGVFLIGFPGGEARRVNAPPSLDSGRAVAWSHDGRSLAASGCAGDDCGVWVIDVGSSVNPRSPARLLTNRTQTVDGIAWSADGSAVVVSEFVPGLGLGQGPGQQLVKVAIDDKSEPQPLSFAGQGVTAAAIARTGSRLAYSKTQADSDIWKLEDGEFTRSPVSSTLHDGSAQYSLDGSKVVFNSSRSGRAEIWVANADGSDAVKLTDSLASGSPSWSPNGMTIVYDSRSAEGVWDVHIMDTQGGTSRQLSTDGGHAPSFSRDGRWVYYTRGDGIWRVPSDGGRPVLVTNERGRAARESADGRSLYHTVGSGCGPLYVRPLGGGAGKALADSVCYRAFTVTPHGVYYVSGSTQDPEFTVRLLDPATGKSTVLAHSKGRYLGQGLTVSPDGKTVLLSASTRTDSDLYLVENFR